MAFFSAAPAAVANRRYTDATFPPSHAQRRDHQQLGQHHAGRNFDNNFSPREEIATRMQISTRPKRDCLTATLPSRRRYAGRKHIVGDGGGIDEHPNHQHYEIGAPNRMPQFLPK